MVSARSALHFGHESTTPGWMTAMGRAYILFGMPTSRHPFTGYSQIYPLELWFYENNTSSAEGLALRSSLASPSTSVSRVPFATARSLAR